MTMLLNKNESQCNQDKQINTPLISHPVLVESLAKLTHPKITK